MNRIFPAHGWRLPQPKGSFTDAEAFELQVAYNENPAGLSCPRCYADTIEVLCFIVPEIDANGYATEHQPLGHYAAVVYCQRCKMAIGLERYDHADNP